VRLEIKSLLQLLLQTLIGILGELTYRSLMLGLVLPTIIPTFVVLITTLMVLLLLEFLEEAITVFLSGAPVFFICLLFSTLGCPLLFLFALCDSVTDADNRVVNQHGIGLLEYLEVLDMLDLEEDLLDLLLAGEYLIAAASASPLSPAVLHVLQPHRLRHRVHLGQDALVTGLHRRDYT